MATVKEQGQCCLAISSTESQRETTGLFLERILLAEGDTIASYRTDDKLAISLVNTNQTAHLVLEKNLTNQVVVA